MATFLPTKFWYQSNVNGIWFEVRSKRLIEESGLADLEQYVIKNSYIHTYICIYFATSTFMDTYTIYLVPNVECCPQRGVL